MVDGLLFGLALGDALGWPVEFDNLTAIKQRYGPAGIQEPPTPALYTDDTQMTLALAEGLLDAGLDATLDAQMQAVGRRFITWRHSPDNNRAPGTTCIRGVDRYEQGMSWREAGISDSKGCGSAMRVAPIGYLFQHDWRRLREVAEASSLITHRHPAAVAASIAGAYLVKLALDGVPVEDYMRRVLAFIDGVSDEFDAAILRIGHVLGWTNEEAALDHIGQGWTGEEAIALALYCVIRYPNDYVGCVRRAANTNGDSDSIACIAGGIMGARLGIDAIPAAWRERCENRDYLADVAARLRQARELSGYFATSYSADTQVFSLDAEQPDTTLIEQAAERLRAGGLVAFPTETVYGLGANAFDAEAVGRIFSAKGRPASDPIIVHLHDLAQIGQVAVDVPDLVYRLAREFWPGPLTLVLRRGPKIPPIVTAGMDTVAVRMPDHPVARALLEAANVPVAAPSANRFARPSATTAAHVLQDLAGRVDVVLDGGSALIGVESTVLDLTKTPPVILRPGGITLERLRDLIPDVQLASKYLQPEDAGIEAPGMLAKHYSPRAELLLFTGTTEQVLPVMQTWARELAAQGKRVGILALSAEKGYFEDIPVTFFGLGETVEQVAANLFTGMRALDDQAVDVMLAHGVEQAGLGVAIWDRLLRAAEGRVIQC